MSPRAFGIYNPGERLMIIENYGAGARCAEALRLLLADENRKLPPQVKRIVLLPIPTSRDKVHLSGTDKLLGEIFGGVGAGDLIAGYGIDDNAKLMMRERGAIVYDALDDESFLAENAEETALGVIGYILTSTDTVPSDTRFTVVGYGRIGSRLVRMLLFLGAKVKVYTGKLKTSVSLGECGIEARLFGKGDALDTSDTDVIINTAPTDLSASFKDGKVPKNLRVIELASGENFKGVEGVERLPGIPDKSYGKSAGQSYYLHIIKYVSEVTK